MGKTLIFLSFAIATSAFAQEQDFGNLLPEGNFEIKNKRSSLKDTADVSNYEIKVTPTREEFNYKVNGITSPRRSVFSKRRSDHKLVVEKADGKVSRITNVTFSPNGDHESVQSMVSTSLLPSGHVNSYTNCKQEFSYGLRGRKKTQDNNTECVTVTSHVCEYIETSNIDDALMEEMKNCSTQFAKFLDHQTKMKELLQESAAEDIGALRQMDGRIKNLRNFYEVDAKTVKGMVDLATGYSRASDQCKFLKENNYFKPKEETEAKPEENADVSAQ